MRLPDRHHLADDPTDPVPRSERFWTVPNGLSLVRLALTVPFLIAVSRETPTGDVITWIVVAVAFLSDSLDGWYARHFNAASRWGLLLDPLADKAAVFSLGLALVMYREFPSWAFVFILCRDAYIFLGGLALWRQYHVPSVSHPAGKWGVTLVSVAMIAYLARLELAGFVMLCAGLIVYLHSTFEYTVWAINARDEATANHSTAPDPPAADDAQDGAHDGDAASH